MGAGDQGDGSAGRLSDKTSPLSGQESTIDRDHRSGGVARCWHAQECNGVGDVVGLAPSLEGDAVGDAGARSTWARIAFVCASIQPAKVPPGIRSSLFCP